MCKMCDMTNNFIEKSNYDKAIRKDLIATYDNKKYLFWGTFNLLKYENDDQIYLEVGGDSIAEIPISYCPFCGQILKINKEQ